MTPEHFNTLYRGQLVEISRFISRRVDQADVDDLASELFEIAWNKRATIQEGLELAWLYKTARYLIANLRRKTQNRNRILASISFPDSAPSAESIALADIELAGAWSKLSAKDRELLALWALEGLEVKQIAHVMEISDNACAIRLSRAKEKLRVLLADENLDAPETSN